MMQISSVTRLWKAIPGVGEGLKIGFGYARLHKNVTKVESRLRSIKQQRNRGRFPVTLGYTKT